MVRRLVVALMVVVVMAATVVVGPTVALNPGGETSPVASASAQLVGQPVCGPWYIAWYVSRGLWWYGWSWRWCWNPSLQNPWYVDWASWAWDGYAGPGYSPGYYYSVPAGPGPG
jgi:hypothetical protein